MFSVPAPDASRFMAGAPLPGQHLTVDTAWTTLDRKHLVAAAVADGRLTQDQADHPYHIYYPQPDGTLFWAMTFTGNPDVILGTLIPKGAWRPR